MDVTVPRHPQAAVTRSSLCVQDLQLRVLEVFPVLEKLGSDGGVDDGGLKHPGEDHIGSHCFCDPPHHFFLFGTGVILCFSFSIGILSSLVFFGFLFGGRLFLFSFEVLLELLNDLELFAIGIADGLLDLVFISEEGQFAEFGEDGECLSNGGAELYPLLQSQSD